MCSVSVGHLAHIMAQIKSFCSVGLSSNDIIIVHQATIGT